MGTRSKFPPLFTPSIYFLLYFLVAVTITFPLCLILCKQQGQRVWQPLCTRWEKSYLLSYVGPGEVSNLRFWTAPLFTLPPICRSWSPTGRSQPWYLCQGKLASILHLNLPLWVNQWGARIHQCAGVEGKIGWWPPGAAQRQPHGVGRSFFTGVSGSVLGDCYLDIED